MKINSKFCLISRLTIMSISYFTLILTLSIRTLWFQDHLSYHFDFEIICYVTFIFDYYVILIQSFIPVAQSFCFKRIPFSLIISLNLIGNFILIILLKTKKTLWNVMRRRLVNFLSLKKFITFFSQRPKYPSYIW